MRHNYEDWLVEQDMPQVGGQPDPAGLQAPMTGMGAGPGGYEDPSATNVPDQGMEPEPDQKPDDVTQDPEAPDMPEKKPEKMDFETWKNQYFKEIIKGDSNELIDLIHQVRDRDLDTYERKFVEDNLQVQFLRQDANIEKASKEIVKNVKEELDENHPGVSFVNHMVSVLEANPILNSIFIKCTGLWGAKQDMHRKFVAALLNAVQVGGGGVENEDIIYNDNELSVRASTRFNAVFGNVILGNWSLKEDDAEKYLKPPELKRLEEGSPEERDVLMRRIIVESIVETFKRRAFLINVVDEDGTIYHLGMDLAELLQSAYKEGKLVAKTTESENSDAMISDDGTIIPYIDLNIYYTKPTGAQDEEGKPEVEELDFFEKRSGQLFLTASLKTLKDASTTSQGLVMKETPFTGNPSDLPLIARCVPSVAEILTRRC
jgi:hypothetical protein